MYQPKVHNKATSSTSEQIVNDSIHSYTPIANFYMYNLYEMGLITQYKHKVKIIEIQYLVEGAGSVLINSLLIFGHN